jgi:hypothetical protein
MNAAPTEPGVVHRTPSARIRWIALAIGGVLTIIVGVSQGVPGSWWFSFVVGASSFVAAARTRRSGVRVDSDGVTVMNLVRDIRVPWSDVDHFEVADDGPFSSWGRGHPFHRWTHGWVLTSSRGWIPVDCTASNTDDAARLVFLLEEARKAHAQRPASSER